MVVLETKNEIYISDRPRSGRSTAAMNEDKLNEAGAFMINNRKINLVRVF